MKIVKSFGEEWRIDTLPAIQAKVILDSNSRDGIFSSVSVFDCDKGFVRLDSDRLVDQYVKSWEWLAPLEVLAMEENFGFLREWRPVTLPSAMRGQSAGAARYRAIDPLFGTLISENLATLHELRTVYSLQDAFIMLDCMMVKKVNEFLASPK